jgi:hypothetical protein
VTSKVARARQLARRRCAWVACFGGILTGCLGLSSPAAAHILPIAVAEQRAEAFLEDLADDPLDPVISSEYWCFRISHHRVRCDLFAEYLAGDTCVFDYYVFFAGPHSQQIRTRLGNCE